MTKILTFTVLLAFTFLASEAQIGINILVPDSSAVLQLESSKKGLGLSRLTSQQRDQIVSPLKGLTIFNTEDSVIEYWNGQCWLKTYEKNCYDCEFTMTSDHATDTIDRAVSDSSFTTITINQTHGNQPISLSYVFAPPPGVNVYFVGGNTIQGSGSIKLVVKIDPCTASGGTFPIIVTGFCGEEMHFLNYSVYTRKPIEVDINTDVQDYNLQVASGLPAGSSQFILVNVGNSVAVSASSTATTAFTTGNFNANSLVCIVNDGDIYGKGGDGASFDFSGGLLIAGGNPGKAGGDAMHLSTRTVIQNHGSIFGGGSGGGSVGFAAGVDIPVLGTEMVGFGFCGGGGAESGAGGTVDQTGVLYGVFKSGDTATCCAAGIPGDGPDVQYPLSPTISIITLNITPDAHGGNGGAFGEQGTQGYLDIQLQVCATIPVVGPVCVDVSSLLSSFVPFYGPASAAPGLAVSHGSNQLIGLYDGTYFSSLVRGIVGP